MMIKTLKQFASHLPLRCQQELKRRYFGRQIRSGAFKSNELEFARLDEWVRPGDWVLDIGANVGHYTARLSELVDISGRVIAFEPVPQTFEVLCANMAQCPNQNTTLMNVAISEETKSVGMTIPKFDTGLINYYEAQLTSHDAELSVLSVSIDSLRIPRQIRLAKIDVEGHEMQVLNGMTRLTKRDHPVLIVEGRSLEVASYLESLGYFFEEAEDSPNRVFHPIRGDSNVSYTSGQH